LPIGIGRQPRSDDDAVIRKFAEDDHQPGDLAFGEQPNSD
jgi:hypothetical protein